MRKINSGNWFYWKIFGVVLTLLPPFLSLFLIDISCVQLATAKEVRYLHRSPKGLMMGDAFTAVADDEYTLFYNPAALGRHRGVSAYFINPDVSVTNVLDEMDRFKNFPQDDPVGIAERVIGLPLHLHLAGTPGFKLASFGMSFFANFTTNISLKNYIHPAVDVDYRYDRGFVIGYAYTLGSGFKPKREGRRKKSSKSSSAGKNVSLGLAVKHMNRQGIDNSFDLFGAELLNIISEGKGKDFNQIRNDLGYSKGSAWGVDSGVEFSWTSGRSQFNLGVAAQDIGNTTFEHDEGTERVPTQDMLLSIGTSFRQDFALLDYTLSLDVHPINQDIDYLRRMHVGFELGIPFVSLLLGWNGGYVSYGVQLELWPIKILAGFYGVELGGKYGQLKGNRGMIYISILNLSFDS
ncbi:MAG: hypothetical protein HQK53_10925 [Oligoflexia bacterium]|nr:hypothetical protein [Oligoflexia bacterium]